MASDRSSGSGKLRSEGMNDTENQRLMAAGYPPGPHKAAAKRLNLRDINTYQRLHDEFGDIFMLPLGKIPLVVQAFAQGWMRFCRPDAPAIHRPASLTRTRCDSA